MHNFVGWGPVWMKLHTCQLFHSDPATYPATTSPHSHERAQWPRGKEIETLVSCRVKPMIYTTVLVAFEPDSGH